MGKLQQYLVGSITYVLDYQKSPGIDLLISGRIGNPSQDMKNSSNKRVKLLDVDDNVRIPIPSVDRPPLCPTSLVGAVMGVSSSGNTLQLGTKHGRIASRFTHSEVSPCGSNQLLAPTDVPDVQLPHQPLS